MGNAAFVARGVRGASAATLRSASRSLSAWAESTIATTTTPSAPTLCACTAPLRRALIKSASRRQNSSGQVCSAAGSVALSSDSTNCTRAGSVATAGCKYCFSVVRAGFKDWCSTVTAARENCCSAATAGWKVCCSTCTRPSSEPISNLIPADCIATLGSGATCTTGDCAIAPFRRGRGDTTRKLAEAIPQMLFPILNESQTRL